jgi:hypothetical protein
MNGAVLLFTVCFLGAHERCLPARLELPEMTITSCDVQAQPLIAQWLGERSDVDSISIRMWHCVESGREETPT